MRLPEHERCFYEIEATENNWSLRELNRQFNSALYDRLRLSRDKEGVKALSENGQLINNPQDAVKDPYILEFLGLKEENSYTESELEQAIIDKLKHQDLGQIQMYVNYYDRFVKTDDENPTIGIVLSKDKKDSLVEITLPKDNKQIFTSQYQTYLPTKAEFIAQIDEVAVAK